MTHLKLKKFIIRNSLFVILIVAALLRFWELGSYPALNADEASIGYDAYSLIKTGMDQHGNPWPVHFQSFNDYKPGLVEYIVLPFIKFFGLNVWSVRIPGALIGVATIYVVYLLVKELGLPKMVNDKWKMEILAPTLLAISPWHIHFSRGMWEVNVATFFMTLGTYLFIKAIKKRSFLNYTFSFLSFSLSLYTYHSARVVSPLLMAGLVLIYRRDVFSDLKKFLTGGLVASIFLLPLVFDLSKGAVFSRAAGVGLFADKGAIVRINEQRGEHGNFNSPLALLIHNKPVNYGLEFVKNWTQHFHGLFLFVSGDDIQRNKVPETGEIYIFDVIWLVIGVWWMVKYLGSKNAHPEFASKSIKNNDKKTLKQNWYKKGIRFVFWWLVVAPIAAALTFQSPHALRAQNMVIPLIIIASAGLIWVVNWLKVNIINNKILTTCYVLLTTLILWQFARYLHMYWVHMSKEYPFSSQYGLEELTSYISENGSKYQKILITDKYDQPYILFLFYLKYPPQEFQANHTLSTPDKYGFSTVRTFDKYEFREINWDEDNVNYKNSLIVGTPDEIPNESNIVERIYGTNGYEYFDVVAN